jgi:hypothetical protein
VSSILGIIIQAQTKVAQNLREKDSKLQTDGGKASKNRHKIVSDTFMEM